MRVHVLVSLNPDGFMASRQFAQKNNGRVCWLCGRNNFNNKDLNRNFPYLYGTVAESIHLNRVGSGYMNQVKVPADYYRNGDAQPETVSIIRWSENHNFVVSAMVHSGAWVFNYPYDTAVEHPFANKANPSDDENAFIHIGQNFTATQGIMRTKRCPMDKDAGFKDGITNGAAWYSLQGTLQDYGYIGRGIMEVTLEMGCEKTVREAQTGVLYGRNKNAFLYFLWQTYTGIFGTVTDRDTYEGVVGAEIFVYSCTQTTGQNDPEDCSPMSLNYTFNRLSAVSHGPTGQFFKVYYPDRNHNVICYKIKHELYQTASACDWKDNYKFDRPEMQANDSNFKIRIQLVKK